MKTNYKRPPWKVLAAMTMVLSGLLYAVAVFDPISTPTVTLGEYTLKSRDLLHSGTTAYRSWFENGAWQGDIIEYDIGQDGSRNLSHSLVGSNDEAALLVLANDVATDPDNNNWLARAAFLKKETDITDYWKEETGGGRRLFTYKTSGQVAFLWDNLTAAQKLSLDAAKINDPDGDPDTNDAVDPASSQNNDYFSPVMNFIRGDRSNERAQTDGFLRTRYSLLGDITSTPVYIGPPNELYTDYDGFRGFRYANSTRSGAIAAPANDGILHILAEADGSELTGYIPSMVINRLRRLSEPAYQHTYYLDGKMAVTSAQLNPDHDACVDSVDGDGHPVNVSACDWRTVLASGGGAGFEGLFALDMTTPGYTSDKVLFEKTGSDFGHIYGAPRIAALGTAAAPDWYVFTGSGYKTRCTGLNNSNCDTDNNHDTALLMVSLADPTTVHKIDTGTNGGLSSPVLVDSEETDQTVETAFAGDINGDVWMFRLDKADPASSTVRKVFDGSPDLPISNTPAIVRHPDISLGGYLLYFGTGSIFGQDDALNDAIDTDGSSLYNQAIYGIHIKHSWIDGSNTSFDPLEDADLQTQALSPADPPISVTFPYNGETKVVRTTPTSNPVEYKCNVDDAACEANLYSGWRLEFPLCGERLVGAPFIRARRVQFVTNNPTGLNCGGLTVTGDSWMMSLDYLTGASADKVVFNLNGDSDLDEEDTASGVPPVGLALGQGNISQPVFVRLRNGIDKMFVNGLILSLPPIPRPGPLLFGHLDVVTDSPSGGVKATNLIFKHSQGYQTADSKDMTDVDLVNVDAPDGLHGAVDGLFHSYDTINGVSYVDLFELEPRRGLASLEPGSIATNDCSNDPNNTRVPVEVEVEVKDAGGDPVLDEDGNPETVLVTRCIEAVEAELNRAYDTLTRDLLDDPEELIGFGENAKCPDDSTSRYGPFYEAITDPTTGYVIKCKKTVIDPESETYELGGSGSGLLAEDKQFFVLLANADLSPLASLQIGCKVWEGGDTNENPPKKELIELQERIAKGLYGTPAKHPRDILDPKYEQPLIFTLRSIANNTDLNGDPSVDNNGNPIVCPDDPLNPGQQGKPTLRVIFDETAILREGVHATRSQCVLGLHDPLVKVCYSDPEVLNDAHTAVLDTKALMLSAGTYNNVSCADDEVSGLPVPERYIKDPALGLHVTPYNEGGFTGYRWRNGALTVQLVDPDVVEVQASDDVPHKGNGSNRVYNGGTYARAFTVDSIGNGVNQVTFYPKDDIAPSGITDESGLLYEAAIFWHYSDLADNIQRADTASIPCYGNSNYGSALAQETRGLNLGQYLEWANALDGTDDLRDFRIALTIINDPNSSEAALNQALLNLAALLDANPILAEWAKYRDYIPGSVIPEQHLLDIDKNLDGSGDTNSSSADGVPAEVTTIETIDLESLGPNAVMGQRNWIDLRQ